MSRFLDVVTTFLEEDSWPVGVEQNGELPRVTTRFSGTSASWECRLRVLEPFGQVIVESAIPLRVPEGLRPAIGELILRINWRLLTGAFQLDSDTGDLLFRTSITLQDGEPLTRGVIKGLIYSNVLTVDRCYSELAAAVEGIRSPDDALVRLAL